MTHSSSGGQKSGDRSRTFCHPLYVFGDKLRAAQRQLDEERALKQQLEAHLKSTTEEAQKKVGLLQKAIPISKGYVCKCFGVSWIARRTKGASIFAAPLYQIRTQYFFKNIINSVVYYSKCLQGMDNVTCSTDF
jgi:hypothetical protein